MKKLLTFFLISLFVMLPVFAATDRTAEEYLKNNKNPFAISFFAENIVTSSIKRSLKKEAPGRYKVKFKGYSLSSIKQGIFKYLEITGECVTFDDIEIPYFNIKTLTDYNWIDYNQSPMIFKADMKLDCVVNFSDKSINDALSKEDYQKILRKINKKVFPLFTISDVEVKLKDSKMYIIISYNFPLTPRDKDRTFMVSSGLNVVNNEIRTCDVAFDNAYGNLPLYKVVNLINLLNPLNFTTKLIDKKTGDCKIEKIKIVDDIVTINGKIYIKGENK